MCILENTYKSVVHFVEKEQLCAFLVKIVKRNNGTKYPISEHNTYIIGLKCVKHHFTFNLAFNFNLRET